MKSLSIAFILTAFLSSSTAVHAEEQQEEEYSLDSLRGMRQALEANDQNHSFRSSTRAERMERMAALTVEERKEVIMQQELSKHGRFLNGGDLLCGTNEGEVGCGRCGEPFLCCCDSSCDRFQDCCSNFEGFCPEEVADLILETPPPTVSPTISPEPTTAAPSHSPSSKPTTSLEPTVSAIPSLLPTVSQVPSSSPTGAPTTPGYCSGQGKNQFGKMVIGKASGAKDFQYNFIFYPDKFCFSLAGVLVEDAKLNTAMISTFTPDLGTTMVPLGAEQGGCVETAPDAFVSQLAFCPDQFYLIVSYRGGFSVGQMAKA